MKNKIIGFAVALLFPTACTTVPAGESVEPGSTITGSLFLDRGCTFISLPSGDHREVAAVNGAQFAGTGATVSFIGKDGSSASLGSERTFVAGEIQQEGKCGDETVIGLHRVVR